ncbi:RepB family plasmid replication initiator protein [uncultured Azohydromonas sp.]|jgi:Predicted membrane protein|uniref:RepB family plasmid replication initiator protein n=1 Tax=uncultured Azohydromonas sp. TaxID=487342 RepID=UPI002632D61C|nr:RepB family plasmid replication initiator protein [uncultured Azohydromonas sp.]
MVVKPVETIALRVTKGKATLLGRRFWNCLVKHAQVHSPNADNMYEMPVAQLRKLAGFDSKNMEVLATTLTELQTIAVNWGDSPKNFNRESYRWESATLLSYASIRKKAGEVPTLVFDFHPAVRPYILKPEVYSLISLEIQRRFRTVGGLVLYEIGERYLSSPNGLSARLHWTEWHHILTSRGRDGGAKGKAPEWKYFKRDVLDPAVREVNKEQDKFSIDYYVAKAGRFTTDLQFVVKARRKALSAPADLEQWQLERLAQWGVPGTEAARLLERLAPADRVKVIETVERRLQKSEQLGDVKSIPAYLHTVVTQGLDNGAFSGEFPDVPDAPLKDSAPWPEEARPLPPMAPTPAYVPEAPAPASTVPLSAREPQPAAAPLAAPAPSASVLPVAASTPVQEPWMLAKDRFLALPDAEKERWYARYEAERVGPQSVLAASPDYGRLPEVRIWRDFQKARQLNPAARLGTSALVYFSKWLAPVWAAEGWL